MKKHITLVLITISASVFFSACSLSNDDPATADLDSVVQQDFKTPARPSEINGLVKSILGNEIVIANELKEALTEEEEEDRKTEMQALSQTERQALNQQNKEVIETETLTLIIPVGIDIVKGSGAGGDGNGGFTLAGLDEIKPGMYLSIWQNEDEVEMVKIKGLN